MSTVVFLTDYIDALHKKGSLSSTDFTGESLDKLANEIVNLKTLPDASKDKLGIDQIVSKLGVSITEGDNRIRYATACTTVLKDKSQITLTVYKPPAGNVVFRIPEAGPPVTQASKFEVKDKGNGFKLLNEYVLMGPVWKPPTSTQKFAVAYSYDHGIPSVGAVPADVAGASQPAPFAWHLAQYCAYDPKKPDEVGDERFIFAGNGKGNLLQGFYMRVEDLKMRVETGSYETAKKDLQALGERNALFPLWYPDGKVVPADIAKARFSMFDPNSTRGSDPQAALFMTFCQIARLARTNSGLYDVLSRFWDLPWDINFTLQIDPKYQQIIRKAAHEDVSDDDLKGLVFDPQPADEDKRLVALIERVKGQRQFRPKFTIEWSVKDLDPSRGERRIWEQHPNGIYKLWIDSRVMLSVMSQPTLGIWLNNRVLQTDEQLAVADKAIQELLKSKHTYKDATSAATTVTEVTKSKVNVVKNYKRNPDQVGAMGGLSPNDLVRKWWGMGEKELGAEWLHRSAWSYGGLVSSGGFDPQSSQVMSNLIIGTHEANTMMLRYEIFVKRLAQFTGVPVRVTTTIQQLLKNELPSVGWYSPRLLYKVETPGSSNVAANFTTQFVTIDRRLPTRLELDLDELFERLVYNWGDSDFMAD